MGPASQRFFIHRCIYLRILIISCLATFRGTNSLSVLMCRKAVNQSINQSIRIMLLCNHSPVSGPWYCAIILVYQDHITVLSFTCIRTMLLCYHSGVSGPYYCVFIHLYQDHVTVLSFSCIRTMLLCYHSGVSGTRYCATIPVYQDHVTVP